MFTEPVRRAAMERARDTGVPAASGRVTLLQEIDSQKQAGFLIYLPFYTGGSIPETVAERRVRLQGFVYSPFRADDFIQGIFGNNQNSYVDFQVYDGTEIRPSRLLYRSDRKWDEVNASNSPHFTAIATLDIAGRPWTLVFNSTLELEQNSERRLILLVALVGDYSASCCLE